MKKKIIIKKKKHTENSVWFLVKQTIQTERLVQSYSMLFCLKLLLIRDFFFHPAVA